MYFPVDANVHLVLFIFHESSYEDPISNLNSVHIMQEKWLCVFLFQWFSSKLFDSYTKHATPI